MVQRLILHTASAGGLGSTPGQGTMLEQFSQVAAVPLNAFVPVRKMFPFLWAQSWTRLRKLSISIASSLSRALSLHHAGHGNNPESSTNAQSLWLEDQSTGCKAKSAAERLGRIPVRSGSQSLRIDSVPISA